MRKISSFAAVVAVVAAVVLSGCGGSKGDFDVASLGNDLNTKITYQDTLAQMDLDTAGMIMNLSDVNVTKAAIYEGAGGTAEEIVVLECASDEDAKKAEQVLKTRVESLTESTAYFPLVFITAALSFVSSSGT